MQTANLDGGAALPAPPDRQHAVENLFINSFSFLKEIIQADPHMTSVETEELVQTVAEHLHEYDGRLADSDFREWLTKQLLPALGLYGIKHTCGRAVRDAIRKVFAGYEWRGDTESARADAEQNAWLWAALHLGELLDPGANPTAWLREIAKFEAMTLRQRMVRGNQRFASGIDSERLGEDYAGAFVIEPVRGNKKDEFDQNLAQPYAREEDISKKS